MERLVRIGNAFHWKNWHRQVKTDKLSSICSKVPCQVHRLYVAQAIRSHQRADDKFLSQHWHSPDITAVKEMPWAMSLGLIIEQQKTNVRSSSILLWAPSTSLSPVCRRQRNPLLPGIYQQTSPWWGWKSLVAICGQNLLTSHCLNHGVMLNHNREPGLTEWAKFTTLKTGLDCNLIQYEPTGISWKKSDWIKMTESRHTLQIGQNWSD